MKPSIKINQDFIIPVNNLNIHPKDIEMIWVLPGEFTMGDALDGLFKVSITDGFWLSKYPVTIGQWQGMNQYIYRPQDLDTKKNHPILLEWGTINKYHQHLNQEMKSSLPEGYHFGLVTEAQWEYAQSAGKSEPSLSELSEEEYDKIGYRAYYKTYEVGQKEPNAWGFHDMRGHYIDWCFDVFIEYPTLGDDFGLSKNNKSYENWCGNLLLEAWIKDRDGINVKAIPDDEISRELEQEFEQRTGKWGGQTRNRAYQMWMEPAMFRVCLRKKQSFDDSDVIIRHIKSGKIILEEEENEDYFNSAEKKKRRWWKRIFK